MAYAYSYQPEDQPGFTLCAVVLHRNTSITATPCTPVSPATAAATPTPLRFADERHML